MSSRSVRSPFTKRLTLALVTPAQRAGFHALIDALTEVTR